MPDTHDCLANARPVIDSQIDGEPVLSATVGDGGFEVYMECTTCGEELTVNYTFEDWD